MTGEEKKNRFFGNKKIRYSALVLFLILALFYLFKSCSFNNFNESTYRIGQDSRWPTLTLMGKERNLSAFNQQLLGAIAKKEKIRIQIEIIPYSSLLNALEERKLEGVITALQPSYLNEKQLVFSEPFFLFGPVLIVSSSAPVQGWNEMGKKIIGIPAHSPLLLSLEQDNTIKLKIYEDILPALKDLSNQKIDGAIFPAFPAYTYVNTFYKNELKIVTLPLTDDGIRLVAPRNKTGESLIKHFNDGLAELKKEGTYNQILERWGLINAESLKN